MAFVRSPVVSWRARRFLWRFAFGCLDGARSVAQMKRGQEMFVLLQTHGHDTIAVNSHTPLHGTVHFDTHDPPITIRRLYYKLLITIIFFTLIGTALHVWMLQSIQRQ